MVRLPARPGGAASGRSLDPMKVRSLPDTARSAEPAVSTVSARRLLVRGVVQGVGFRPFVHRMASKHGLTGWVRNEAGSVHIHVQGDQAAIPAFVRHLHDQAPPLARIDSLEERPATASELSSFRVVSSDVLSQVKVSRAAF